MNGKRRKGLRTIMIRESRQPQRAYRGVRLQFQRRGKPEGIVGLAGLAWLRKVPA